MRHGMDVAINMMRAGNLRLAALPYEKDVYPRDNKIRPIKATKLVWRAWWRELHDPTKSPDWDLLDG
jgi:hypothetical protein